MRISRFAALPLALGLLFAAAPLMAQGPPVGSTGACTDGSYTSAKTKTGACSGHGGVKEWYPAPIKATKSPKAPKAPKAPKTAPAPAPAPLANAPKPAPAPAAPPVAAPTVRVAPIKGAPAAATALCKDGTYSESQHRSGTCSNHKGVKQWLKDIPPL